MGLTTAEEYWRDLEKVYESVNNTFETLNKLQREYINFLSNTYGLDGITEHSQQNIKKVDNAITYLVDAARELNDALYGEQNGGK